MIYSVTSKILKDVRVALDENTVSTLLTSLGDVDTLSLNEIIRSTVIESVRLVVNRAPIYLLDGGSTFGDAVYWEDLYSGWVILPKDFLRLLVFKMSDWERPVYGALEVTDPQYLLQSSRYQGLRGTPQKPVVAIVKRQEGLILEFYSCKSEDATVEQGLYIPLPYIDEDDGIDIPIRCYKSVIYQSAALVLTILGQTDLASAMTALSNELLSIE